MFPLVSLTPFIPQSGILAPRVSTPDLGQHPSVRAAIACDFPRAIELEHMHHTHTQKHTDCKHGEDPPLIPRYGPDTLFSTQIAL